MAPTAAAKALRGIDRLSKAFGKRISRFPLISCEEMMPVGMTTAAVIPGIGIGRTSGIEKTISDVPNEVGPSDCTICSTVRTFCDLSEMSFFSMSEVRRTAALASLDFRLDPTVVAVRPALRTRFGPRLVPPSTDGRASEKGLPGTATVADIFLRIVVHGMCCQAAPANRPHYKLQVPESVALPREPSSS